MIDLEYTEIDGLLYPDIQLDDTEVYSNLGKYGNLRPNYLHKQRPQRYRELLFKGKLAQHCAEIEQFAFDMAERVRGQYRKRHPAPAGAWSGYRHLNRHIWLQMNWYSTILFIVKPPPC